jgi:hypothetical protein
MRAFKAGLLQYVQPLLRNSMFVPSTHMLTKSKQSHINAYIQYVSVYIVVVIPVVYAVVQAALSLV